MKTLAIIFIISSSFLCLYSQKDYSNNIWGAYLNHEQHEMLLNICENNNWFFTTCQSCLTESPHVSEYNPSYDNFDGTYEFINGNLELKNHFGDLIFLFRVVDTMNIKVIYAKQYLNCGDYLNRYSAFFKGHRCFSPISDFFARWAIFDSVTEEDTKTYKILRFSKPGFIFKNEEYEVGQLPDSIFKIK